MDDSDKMMDDAEKMDLALNCDFESSLFSGWADPPESDNRGGSPNRVDPSSSSSQHNQLHGSRKENNDDDDDDEKAASDSDGFLRLPSFSMVDESSTSLKSDQQNQEQQGMDMMITMMKSDSDEQQAAAAAAAAAAASTSDHMQPDSFWQIPNHHQHQGLLSADQLAAALLPFSQQLAMAYGGAMNHHSSTGVVNTISDSESNAQSSQNRVAPSATQQQQQHHHHHHYQHHQQQLPNLGNGNMASTTQINAFSAAAVAASNNAANIAALAQHHQAAAASASMNNSTTTDSSTSATNNNNHNNNNDAADSQHLHPLGIQSSASCPPNVLGTAAAAAAAGLNLSAFFPFAAAAFGGNMEAMGFGSGGGGGGAPFMFPSVAQPQLQQQQAMPQQVSQQQPIASAAGVNHSNPPSFAAPSQQQSAAAPSKEAASKPSKSKKSQSPTPSQPKAKGRSNRRTDANNSATNEELPPFYLFDAPVELRNNFMQSQRMHGLPVSHDSNSLHYGMSVNGFHPQLNAQANPVVMPPVVHLVDARHCKRSECSVKNEREQRRTQKIAELIDQLRINMEKGGWKGEMRSKFHILSTCADYMKHLMKSNADQEEAVKQARSDLEMKERELEEDKNVQERSDPESVTSSLTTSSRGSGSNGVSGGDDSRNNNNSSTSSSSNNNKRKAPESDQEKDSTNKKSRQESGHDPNAVSSGDSGNGSRETEDKVISLGKTASSVSDITDSNRGSSNSGSDGQAGSSNSGSDGQTGEEKSNNECAATNSSISSDAAVAAGEGSHGQEIDPLDVVIRERHPHHHHHHHHDGHKKRSAEAMSGESNFELDYEEVFNQSNIPQLLSTSAGRIIAWNKFFLKATGLTPEEIECMTIFTLVKPDKLSNLFEIVATALRGDGSQERSNETNTGYSSGQTDGEPTSSEGEVAPSTTRSWNYATMTLPCVTFPNTKLRRQTTSDLSTELFMTVTLMADEDPRKRCFHCVFTDCPGTNGALGSITPELLAMLFKQPKKPNDSFEVKRNKVERNLSQQTRQQIEDIEETEAENSS